MLEYDGCARLTIDNINIVTQPQAKATPKHLNLERESFWEETLGQIVKQDSAPLSKDSAPNKNNRN